jgi:signal transduction histidine kinase
MSAPASPLSLGELCSLAPIHLHSYRHGRYQGDDQRATLEAFAPEDRQLLAQIYQTLLHLLDLLKPHHDGHSDCRSALQAYLAESEYANLVAQVSHLGHATAAARPDPAIAGIIHDLRGGAFQALLFRVQSFSLSPEKVRGLQTIYFLVRDHLKIMRNCVADLDPARFYADSLSCAHDIGLLVEKWSEAHFQAVNRPVEVLLDCHYEGTLCESCLEFSSLDRIIYNLMNNAARFASDGLIHFYVLPVPEPDAENIRFVVANRITDPHRQVLADHFPDGLGELFRGGFTTGGHGLGARICADFCAHAYGVFDFDKAKKGGYFGARLIDDYFTTWFHWPRVEH